ncbi:MAG TPA: HEPN domain-containing protein [Bacillales bacterium]|nr:HEPN domain-containing protein [Bacillales bacterium]
MPVEIICYHCQQCAEKYLKGFIASNGEKIPRIHDLVALNKSCCEYDNELRNIESLCIDLTDYGVQMRYPFHIEVEESDANKTLEDAEKIRKFVLSWDEKWRAHLVDQLKVMVGQLWRVGVTEIYIDGSFVENKAHPNDIDGYFECDVRDLVTMVQELNIIEPDKIWTWDSRARKPYKGYIKKQLPMWHKYRVELYPHFGQISGIQDKHGHDLLFPSAFRQTRDSFRPKGIVKIKKQGEIAS